LLMSAAVLAAGAAAGCGLLSTNIFDFTVKLTTQVYSQDFGMATGKVPTVACTSQTDPCSQVASQLATSVPNAKATGRCNTTVAPNQCVADLNVTLAYPLTLAEDQSFASSLGGKVIDIVNTIDLAYGVPTNTTTFNIPEMQLYIGPSGAQSATDAGVELIDKIPAIARGTTIPDASRHIILAEGTKARDQFIYYIKNPQKPFVLLLVTKPTVKGGDDMPAGKLELRLTPSITVGLPR